MQLADVDMTTLLGLDAFPTIDTLPFNVLVNTAESV